MIDYTTKKYIFLEDYWLFIKDEIYDINLISAKSYKEFGAKIISLEEWRELQINKIINNV